MGPLDKSLSAHRCPECGAALWNYWEEDTGLDLGAKCENCDFSAPLINGRLVVA